MRQVILNVMFKILQRALTDSMNNDDVVLSTVWYFSINNILTERKSFNLAKTIKLTP